MAYSGANKTKTIETSDHYDGDVFFNPSGLPPKGAKNLIRWLRGKRKPWPRNVRHPKLELPDAPMSNTEIHVTFLGHVTFLIRTKNWTLITDPHFSNRASPFRFIGPRRICPPAFSLKEIPKIDYTFVSHNHYDHLDLKSLKKLQKKHKPQIITPLKNGDYLKLKNIHNSTELDWWESTSIADATLTLTPAQHWSARWINDQNKMLWGGFVLSWKHHQIHFTGDSGYGDHFKQIKEKFGPMSLSLLPIGAYEPRWFMKGHHMNPDDAAKAHLDLESKKSIGMHFGTFRLTNESVEDPIHDLKKARVDHGISEVDFTVPQHGETFQFR